MAMILLDAEDVQRIRAIVAGQRQPHGLRRGTWAQITRDGSLEDLTAREFRALVWTFPAIASELGLLMPPHPAA